MQQSDEFDYESGEDDDLAGRKGTARYGEGGSGYTGQPMHDKSKMVSSLPFISRGAEADAYTDPFDPERLPESVRRQQAPLPLLSQEPKEAPHSNTDHLPKGSPTTPLFEGGTKFKEQF